jgi:hypothetical protein
VPAKVENAPNKFDENQVQYEGSGPRMTISRISLGGTRLRLIFN